ncbi:MAG: DJ-1 family glyoxalase III [Negativicutes bacterium]|jgi:4-methyl-5(b-hydroxyethyl)-thiazole monophosphate biosynthesis
MKKALIIIANGTEEIEATTLANVLRRADVEVTLAGVGGKTLRGSRNIIISADIELDEIVETAHETYDMLILPGGWGGTLVFCEDENVQLAIKRFDGAKKMICAICAAPLALDRANILLHHRFTCYPGIQQKMSALGYENRKFIVSDNILTSQGPATAMDFALRIIRIAVGENIFQSVAAELLYEI